MSRPTKLTDELSGKICSYIEQGNTYRRACALCRVAESTFYDWVTKGKETRTGKYRDFYEAVKAAENRFIAFHQAVINQSAKKGDWRASAWTLARKARGEYGDHPPTPDSAKTWYERIVEESDGEAPGVAEPMEE